MGLIDGYVDRVIGRTKSSIGQCGQVSLSYNATGRVIDASFFSGAMTQLIVAHRFFLERAFMTKPVLRSGRSLPRGCGSFQRVLGQRGVVRRPLPLLSGPGPTPSLPLQKVRALPGTPRREEPLPRSWRRPPAKV